MGQRQPTPINPSPHELSDYMILEQFGSDEQFFEALVQQELIIVSDGSAKDNMGAAAWIITSDPLYSSGFYIRGKMKVPKSNAIDSHRAECFGIFGGIYSLSQLVKRTHLPTTSHTGENGNQFLPQVQVGCDNISALRSSLDCIKYPHIGSQQADFDIIQSTRSILPTNIAFSWRHVKGQISTSGEHLTISWMPLPANTDQPLTFPYHQRKLV